MVLVRRLLLVHPGRVGLGILVVSVDVRAWHHLRGGGGLWETLSELRQGVEVVGLIG